MSAAEHKKLALLGLYQLLGDDLIRARNAFRNCTPEQMEQQHGQSGKTRAEIIAEYEAHDAKIKAAIVWLEGVQ